MTPESRKAILLAKAQQKRRERAKKIARGLKKLELWEPPEHHSRIKAYAQKLSNQSRR